MGNIAISKLQPHPKNGYYFTDISGEKYAEVKRSIEANGIRDAIKCTPAFTVISGHQRLRIAKDLGLTEVPVEIIDVDEWEAEYLLIAENVERRGVAEQDAIKKARIAQFLKEYWGIKQGSRSDLVENQRSMKDVAETIGESEWSTRQILKLNKLIPQLQMMVSNGKLSQTNAQELALLTEETQSALYDALGEEIGERTVAETKQLRQEANGKSADEIQAMLDVEKAEKEQAQAERAQALTENQRLRDDLLRVQIPQVIEKEVVKEVVPEDMQRKYDAMVAEIRQMEQSLARNYERIAHLEKLEKVVRSQEESPMYDLTRSLQTVNRHFDTFTAKRGFMETAIASAEQSTVDALEIQMRRTIVKAQEVLSSIDSRNGVVTVLPNTTNMTEVVIYE